MIPSRVRSVETDDIFNRHLKTKQTYKLAYPTQLPGDPLMQLELSNNSVGSICLFCISGASELGLKGFRRIICYLTIMSICNSGFNNDYHA